MECSNASSRTGRKRCFFLCLLKRVKVPAKLWTIVCTSLHVRTNLAPTTTAAANLYPCPIHTQFNGFLCNRLKTNLRKFVPHTQFDDNKENACNDEGLVTLQCPFAIASLVLPSTCLCCPNIACSRQLGGHKSWHPHGAPAVQFSWRGPHNFCDCGGRHLRCILRVCSPSTFVHPTH